MNKYIKKINYHLGNGNKNSFLEKIYEQEYFDKELFNELIYNIKKLHREKNLYSLFNLKYNECVGNNFLANIIQRFWLLLNIYGDIRCYNNYNISEDEYHEYIEELSYELQSLFAGWDKDFHGNKYR